MRMSINHSRSTVTNLPEDISCIMPRAYAKEKYGLEDLSELRMAMEDMQLHHEQILTKVLATYKAHVTELAKTQSLSRESHAEARSAAASNSEVRSAEKAISDLEQAQSLGVGNVRQEALLVRLERLALYGRRLLCDKERSEKKTALLTAQRDRLLKLRGVSAEDLAELTGCDGRFTGRGGFSGYGGRPSEFVTREMMSGFRRGDSDAVVTLETLKDQLFSAVSEKEILKNENDELREKMARIKEEAHSRFLKELEILITRKRGIGESAEDSRQGALAKEILMALEKSSFN